MHSQIQVVDNMLFNTKLESLWTISLQRYKDEPSSRLPTTEPIHAYFSIQRLSLGKGWENVQILKLLHTIDLDHELFNRRWFGGVV